MEDFTKLQVYQLSKSFSREVITQMFPSQKLPEFLKTQLAKAALSITLNIAEGMGRSSSRDQAHFLTIARGSAFECFAILEIVRELHTIAEDVIRLWMNTLDRISKMIYSLILRQKRN